MTIAVEFRISSSKLQSGRHMLQDLQFPVCVPATLGYQFLRRYYFSCFDSEQRIRLECQTRFQKSYISNMFALKRVVTL